MGLGQVIHKANPNQGGVVDPMATSFMRTYANERTNFISAAGVFPSVPVTAAAGKYQHWPKGSRFRDEMGPRPHGGRARQMHLDVESVAYQCDKEYLAIAVDDDDRDMIEAGAINYDFAAVETLTEAVLIHRDVTWINAFWKTGVWGTDRAGVSSGPTGTQFLQWDQSGATPINDIHSSSRTIQKATGRKANTLVLGADLVDHLLTDADVKDWVKHTQAALPNLALLASLFQVERVIEASAVYSTAAENESSGSTMAHIADSKSFLLCHSNPGTAALTAPSAGYYLQFSRLHPQNPSDFGAIVNRSRNPESEHSDWFEAVDATHPVLVASDMGLFGSAAIG